MADPIAPPEPSPLARPPLHPLLRSFLYLLTFFLCQRLLSAGVAGIGHLLEDKWLGRGSFLTSNEALLVTFALVALPALGITKLFVEVLDRRTLASLGLRWPVGGRRQALRELVTLPLAALALIGGWFLLLLALPHGLAALHVGGLSADMLKGRAWWPLPPILLFPILLLLFLVQGGIEELVIRGYVYHALRERWRAGMAALASSMVFALLHTANPGISAAALINIVLAGLVLAALVERSQSLWGATVAHGVWNFSLSCLASLPVSGFPLFHLLKVSVTGDERATGGIFGPEGSLALTALGLPLAAYLWWRMPARPAGDVEDTEDTPLSAPEDAVPHPPL
ncbi:MAG TPA: CPBP family intramembrane glutamic endopeptidase [Thermoanaerobaculia bacterium]|nr:CPBP family intramembrane glutamic endopeptidase [Thermoanaerobaculia bacterium]